MRVDLKAQNVFLALKQCTLAPITSIRQIGHGQNSWSSDNFMCQTHLLKTRESADCLKSKPRGWVPRTQKLSPTPLPSHWWGPRPIKGYSSLSTAGVDQNIALHGEPAAGPLPGKFLTSRLIQIHSIPTFSYQ